MNVKIRSINDQFLSDYAILGPKGQFGANKVSFNNNFQNFRFGSIEIIFHEICQFVSNRIIF